LLRHLEISILAETVIHYLALKGVQYKNGGRPPILTCAWCLETPRVLYNWFLYVNSVQKEVGLLGKVMY